MKRFISYLIYFMLLVPPLIFFTDLTRNPYYFQIVLINSATVLLWMAWLWEQSKAGKLTLQRTPFDAPLLLFFAVATVSWLVVLIENTGQPYLFYGVYSEGLKRWLFLLVNSILVYYAAVFFVDDSNRRRLILITFWTGIFAAVYGILQYFGIEFFWPRVLNPFGGRSVSTFGNPNFLSSYLVMLFPLVYAFYYRATGARRAFYFVVMTIFFASLLCTLTRSSWLGLFAAMTFTVAVLWKYERQAFMASLKVIFIPFAVFIMLVFTWPKSTVEGYTPSVLQRITESTKVEQTHSAAYYQRRLIWSCAWHMAVENPVLGKGWGCFELFYPFYQGRHLFLDTYRNLRTHANNTHDEILEIWSQTGMLGFGLYLWLLVSIVAYGFYLIRNLSGHKRVLAICLLASCIGMWVDNLLNVSLHFAIPAFLYWWQVGLLVTLGQTEQKTVVLGGSWQKPALWLLIGLGGIAIVRYTNNFLGEMNYFKGFKYSKRDNVALAIPALEQAHRLQRFEVNNNYELANCYARAGQRDKALEFYRESLRANAGYDEIYFNMATVLVQKGQPEAAIPEYSRSLYINPLSLESYAALGSIFLQDPERYAAPGISLFKQALQLVPQNRDVWNNLGYLHTKAGRNEEALEAYRKALEIDPDFELARKNFRVTLNRLGRTTDPFLENENLLRAVEDGIVAKNWSRALADCERLVTRLPNSFKARFYLANIYFTVGRMEQAIEHYKAALIMQPGNLSLRLNLGLAYSQSRQFQPALEQFRLVLQKDPQNQVAQAKIAEINALLAAPRR